MSAIVLNALATSIAALERNTDIPTEPFGYGSDIATTIDGDLDEQMSDVNPDSVEAFAQAMFRRLDCPRGALPGDANYGIDVCAYLNDGVTTFTVEAMADEIRSEVTKDDRIAGASVKVVLGSGGLSLSITISITPVDPSVGNFTLTFAATSAALVLEQIRKAA